MPYLSGRKSHIRDVRPELGRRGDHMQKSVGRTDIARRLSDERLAEIKQIAGVLLGQTGYENFTFDELAKKARCSKSTLYRHWKGKAGLVMDVMDHDVLVVADTGSLHGDLEIFIASVADGLKAWGSVLLSLAWALGMDQDLAQLWRTSTKQNAERHLATIVDRAVARGEIRQPRDLPVLSTVIPASFVWYLAFNQDCDHQAFGRRFLNEVILPVLRGGGSV